MRIQKVMPVYKRPDFSHRKRRLICQGAYRGCRLMTEKAIAAAERSGRTIYGMCLDYQQRRMCPAVSS